MNSIQIISIIIIVLSITGFGAMIYMWARNSGIIALDYFSNITNDDNYLAGKPTYSNHPYIPVSNIGGGVHPKFKGWLPGELNNFSEDYELVDNPIQHN